MCYLQLAEILFSGCNFYVAIGSYYPKSQYFIYFSDNHWAMN